MNKALLFALMICCGLAALGCGGEGEGGGSECPADLHLEVGSSVCDFAAGEVECFFGTEVDDGYELEIVFCGGENDTCEFEFLIALYEGEPVDGEIGVADESQDYEAEGDLVPDVWELEMTDGRMTLSFAGTLDGEGSPAVAGCIDDLPWTAGNPEEDEDDDDEDDEDSCQSDDGDGHFYCEEITDEEVCAYIVELCDEDDVSEGSCCEWNPEAGNCGGAADDLPCYLIDDQGTCDTISGECYWETESD